MYTLKFNPGKEAEWNDPRLNLKIRAMVTDTLLFISSLYAGREIVVYITHILRKKEQQDYFYGAGAPESVHEYWRGLDLVIIIDGKALEYAEYNIITNYLNSRWSYYGKQGCDSALVHEIKATDGKKQGLHIHLQVGPKDPTVI